jgi:hypothetical protein
MQQDANAYNFVLIVLNCVLAMGSPIDIYVR